MGCHVGRRHQKQAACEGRSGGGWGWQTELVASLPAYDWELFVIEKDLWRFRSKKMGWLKTILRRKFELKTSEFFVSNAEASPRGGKGDSLPPPPNLRSGTL